MDARTDAEELPRLDVFDEEFAHEPAAILRGYRRKSRLWLWVFLCLLVGAGASAFALAWPEALAALRTDLPSFSTAGRDDAAEEIGQLQRQITELKQELQELAAAQQQAEETIAALRTHEPEAPGRGSWFSEPAALLHGVVVVQAEAPVPAPRGTVAARPRTGEARRGPISLEPQQ
jgi:hypothetical protein